MAQVGWVIHFREQSLENSQGPCINIAKPMLFHYPQCHHCLFVLKCTFLFQKKINFDLRKNLLQMAPKILYHLYLNYCVFGIKKIHFPTYKKLYIKWKICNKKSRPLKLKAFQYKYSMIIIISGAPKVVSFPPSKGVIQSRTSVSESEAPC